QPGRRCAAPVRPDPCRARSTPASRGQWRSRLRPPSRARDRAIDSTPIPANSAYFPRSEEHTSELQSLTNLVCRLLLDKKKDTHTPQNHEDDTQYGDDSRHAAGPGLIKESGGATREAVRGRDT